MRKEIDYKPVTTLMDLFNVGMMREHPEVIEDVGGGMVLNIGSGSKTIQGTYPLDLPEWNAEVDKIPFSSNSVDQIHAYHILEHVQDIFFLMSEIQRVLVVGGHINIVVPYYSSALQACDLDHKHSFSEKTFSHLFNTSYYKKNKLPPMEIVTNMIMGDCEANLCLVVQLRKIA